LSPTIASAPPSRASQDSAWKLSRKLSANISAAFAGEVVDEYTEIESGSHANRPQLQLALQQCRRERATLLIAKLDRLARDVHFISGLIKTEVEFVAVDMPAATNFTIHILAAVAEHERDMASQRTKAALQAAKARGVQLGSPRARETIRAARESRMKQADKKAKEFYAPIITSIQASGLITLRDVAGALNARGIPSPAGRQWHPTSVKRVLDRGAAL